MKEETKNEDQQQGLDVLFDSSAEAAKSVVRELFTM